MSPQSLRTSGKVLRAGRCFAPEIVEKPVFSTLTTAANRFLLKSSLMSVCVVVFFHAQIEMVHASCGDYLAGRVMSSHESPIEGNALAERAKSALPKSPLQPCSGPNCRQHQESPPTPSAPRIVPVTTEMVLTPWTVVEGTVDVSSVGACEGVYLPVSDVDRIFKPPKATPLF